MPDIYWEDNYDEDNQLYSMNLKFPDGYWPVTVKGGETWERRDWDISLPQKLLIHGIWTFLGHDRGDVAESDIGIETDTGIPLVLRSEHRVFDRYDADKYYPLNYRVVTQHLKLWLKSHPTTRKSVRYHVVIRVIGRIV